jgi:hypothetical protein
MENTKDGKEYRKMLKINSIMFGGCSKMLSGDGTLYKRNVPNQ